MKSKRFVSAAKVLFLLIAAGTIMFSTCSTKKSGLADGTWNGVGNGRNGPVELALTVKNGNVSGVEIVSEEETDFAKPAIQEVISQFLAKKSFDKIDAVSGATISSDAAVAALKDAYEKAKGVTSATGKVSDTSCDIVVIGAGGAGMSAALAANEKGANVIIVEKMGIVGGNTNNATGGLNASQTKIQEKLGISDSNEQYIADTMKGGYNLNDPDLVKNMVEKSSDTVDWLISLGADLTDVGKMAGSSNNRTHRPQGGGAVGIHLVQVLNEAVKSKGIDLRTNSKVTEIINEGGKAAGVKVSSKDGDYTIKAKAVILATGGFGANPELIVKYNSKLEGFGTTNHKGATGDAFALVEPFKAALVQMDQIQTHPTVVPGNGIMITEAVRGNGAIMVNREGKRFGNEMATRDVMSADVLKQTGKTAYLLFDQGVRESLKAIEGYVKQGLLTEGATPEELAKKLNMPGDALAATIAQYNGYQAAGNDPDFGRKGNEMPRALATGPYYAVEVGPAIHHTMGGVRINTKAELLDQNGSAIPGLFAAGEVTGGVHGGNRLGGNAVADITVYGKIAGESAAAYVK